MFEQPPIPQKPKKYDRRKVLWEHSWGTNYNNDEKRFTMAPIFDDLHKAEKIGEVVVDVGNGASPVSQYIPGEHKMINIDIAQDQQRESKGHIEVQYDIEDLSQAEKFSTQRTLLRIAKFLDVNPRESEKKEHADTMIFSDVLNYVDYEEVLKNCSTYLQPGGRFIIINKPGRGYESLFAEKRIRSNYDLYDFLEKSGFEIEEKHFPQRQTMSTDEEHEFIVLIAKKQNHDQVE